MARFKTLTVGELRDLLEDYDEEALVVFTTDYGDYHRTQQALPLRGEVEEDVEVVESAYSNSGYRLVDADEEDADDADEEDERDALRVLVIK